MYAAVKFYTEKTHVIVPVQYIKQFDPNNIHSNPYMIKKTEKITGEETYEPGEILAVSDDYEQLSQNKKRYKYSKLRLSDALQILAQKNHNSDNEEEPKDDECIESEIVDLTEVNKLQDMKSDKAIKRKLGIINTDAKLNFYNESTGDTITEKQELTAEIERLNNIIEKKNKKLKKKKDKILTLEAEIESLKKKLQETSSFTEQLDEQIYQNQEREEDKEKETHEVNTKKRNFQETSFSEQLDEQNYQNQEKEEEEDKHEKNITKKKKTIKDFLPKLDYDSDSYKAEEDTTKPEDFSPWIKEVGSTKVHMFHLCYGISILKSEWNSAKRKKPSIFIRDLADALWGPVLRDRVFQVQKVCSKKCDNAQVKTFTPKKLAVLQKTYHHFLKLQGYLSKERLATMTSKEKIVLLSEWRVFLKSKVNTLRSGKRKCAAETNEFLQFSDIEI